MQQIELNQFPNIGYLSVNLTNDQVTPILDEVRELEKDFTTGIVANQGLAGNIKKEFTFCKCIFNTKFNKWIPLQVVQEHN